MKNIYQSNKTYSKPKILEYKSTTKIIQNLKENDYQNPYISNQSDNQEILYLDKSLNKSYAYQNNLNSNRIITNKFAKTLTNFNKKPKHLLNSKSTNGLRANMLTKSSYSGNIYSYSTISTTNKNAKIIQSKDNNLRELNEGVFQNKNSNSYLYYLNNSITNNINNNIKKNFHNYIYNKNSNYYNNNFKENNNINLSNIKNYLSIDNKTKFNHNNLSNSNNINNSANNTNANNNTINYNINKYRIIIPIFKNNEDKNKSIKIRLNKNIKNNNNKLYTDYCLKNNNPSINDLIILGNNEDEPNEEYNPPIRSNKVFSDDSYLNNHSGNFDGIEYGSENKHANSQSYNNLNAEKSLDYEIKVNRKNCQIQTNQFKNTNQYFKNPFLDYSNKKNKIKSQISHELNRNKNNDFNKVIIEKKRSLMFNNNGKSNDTKNKYPSNYLKNNKLQEEDINDKDFQFKYFEDFNETIIKLEEIKIRVKMVMERYNSLLNIKYNLLKDKYIKQNNSYNYC